MSVEALNWAFSQTIKKSSTKLVLLALADYANNDLISYPSISTLQSKCTCSRQTVIDSLRELIECGYLTKVMMEHVSKYYNRGQNCYKLLVKKLDQSKNMTSQKIRSDIVQKVDYSSLNNRPEVVKNLDPNHKLTITKPSYNHISNIASQCNRKLTTNFVKPSLDEIKAYVLQKKFCDFDSEYFYDYYESNGWMVAKNKMKCWKSAINNWQRRQRGFKQNNQLSREHVNTKVNAILDDKWCMNDLDAKTVNESNVKALFGTNFYENLEKNGHQLDQGGKV
ncbi:helix-turn-helix domain-containing protein [Thiotrichales bacterium 19S3-7]|nr:helix-turn-helix domain-containing protein [Thiotrichales bacterium 19S3-7]MCF6802803.1 helix-turn-helix domain-containing protein [Thiotrichales bacterium 19S3-11]